MTYTDTLIARFGAMPSPADLAAAENAAMRAKMGLQPRQVMPGVGSQCVSPEMRQRLSEAALEKGRIRMEALLAILHTPMTPDDMATRLRWTMTTVRRALNRAKHEGRVRIARRKAPQLWERV